jgi:hypothetical protein
MKAIAVVTMTFLPATFVSVSFLAFIHTFMRLCVANATYRIDYLRNQLLFV